MPNPSGPTKEPQFDLEYLLNAIPAFVWYKDKNNRIVRCNDAAAKSMGATPAELEGHDTREFYPEEANSYYEDDLEVLRSGHAKRGIVELLPTATGDKIWIRTDKIPVRDDTGAIVGLIVFSIEITDLKQAEQSRADLENRLQQAQKMEALGRLAGGVAHDLNNFLTPILGLSELATISSPSRDELVTDLADIHGAAARAAALVKQLLHFARRQVRNPRRLDLNVTLEQLEPILRRLMPEDIRCEFRTSPQKCVVRADPAELEIVLMNLAANARDAIAGGGDLAIDIESQDASTGSPSSQTVGAPGCWAILRVSDSGAGMDSSTVARMFEPFFTTRQPGSGTGLGLSTVDSIVRQTGGHIEVNSTPGEGTQVEIHLPRLQGEPDEDDPEPNGAPLGNQETVLVVEDQPEVLSLIERILTHQGYRVLAAIGASAAEEIAGRPDQRLDLLLCDVVLADQSGLALAQRLLRGRPRLPVLWTSGYATDVIEAHGVSGPIDLLNKPFSATELTERVRRALCRRTDAPPG